MKIILYAFLPLAFITSGCTSKAPTRTEPARPVKLSVAAAEKIIKEIDKERAENKEWLRSNPMSYLAAAGRIDFGQRTTLSIGRAADNDLVLAAADLEPHHLRITVDGDRFRAEAVDAKAVFKVDDKVKRDATLDPSYIQIGRFHLRLSHQRFPAIIVFDPLNPPLKHYKGLKYFPIDLSFRYELPLTLSPKPEKITISSTRGNNRSAERVGWVDFMVGDTPCRLEATRLLEPGNGQDQISIFFRDATGAIETYPLGRYVDLKKLPNGEYLLDFNQAYNPACAFSEYYNCPIPPLTNTLEVAIRAGEMDSHYH
jgi:uncharacterized protein (DUF1684 family)